MSEDRATSEDRAMNTDKVATRRRFFFGASAALAAPLAAPLALAAAGPAAHAVDAAGSDDRDALAARLAALEDANAIRELQRAYLRHVNAGAHSAVAELFADATRARLDDAVRALAVEAADEVAIEIAADRRTATARMACIVRTEAAIDAPGCTLVDMARAQGEGVLRRSEPRRLEQAFVQQDGVWRIESALFREPA